MHRRRRRRRRRQRHMQQRHPQQYQYQVSAAGGGGFGEAGEVAPEKCHQHFSVRNALAVSGNDFLGGKITLQMEEEAGHLQRRDWRRRSFASRGAKRKRRSISSPRHVETLIVADKTMVAFHDDVETYLLTIMNMVSALYKDPSIGNAIEIVVVKIILLEDNYGEGEDSDEQDDNVLDEGVLRLTQNAQQNLDTFCK